MNTNDASAADLAALRTVLFSDGHDNPCEQRSASAMVRFAANYITALKGDLAVTRAVLGEQAQVIAAARSYREAHAAAATTDAFEAARDELLTAATFLVDDAAEVDGRARARDATCVSEAESAEYLELASRAEGELSHRPCDWGTTARVVMRAAAVAFRRLAAQGRVRE